MERPEAYRTIRAALEGLTPDRTASININEVGWDYGHLVPTVESALWWEAYVGVTDGFRLRAKGNTLGDAVAALLDKLDFRRAYPTTAKLCDHISIHFDGRQPRGAGKEALYQFTDHSPGRPSFGATFYLEVPTPAALDAALLAERKKFARATSDERRAA